METLIVPKTWDHEPKSVDATIDICDGEDIVPQKGDAVTLDAAIIEALPDGCTFLAATAYGSSLWTRTWKISATSSDGSPAAFFLKTAIGELGQTMFRGEFEGMSVIYRTVPDFAPKPIAWGQCYADPTMFFFLSEYIEMSQGGKVPDCESFCAKVAELHKNSPSPTGKFGFPIVTCNGNIPQLNDWEDSWEVFFTKGLRHMLALDIDKNGDQPELIKAIQPIFDKVIPRLLRPLDQGPNPIRPVLVHGDLWCGNTSTNLETDEPVIFDCAAFYAHNEYELGNWRPLRNQFHSAYFRSYTRHFAKAQPEDDFDDRVRLYELRFNFHASIMFPGKGGFKQMLLDSMRYLADKYYAADIQPIDKH